MKVIILAGGMGSRLSEETDVRPKPMVKIGGKPILWHIMKIYSYYGFNDFIVLLGYKGHMIKEYFANYFMYQSDLTIDLSNNEMTIHKNTCDPWKVTLLDTGIDTMTGGRIKRVREHTDGAFMLTYGDGVADINLKEVLNFHKSHGKAATMTSIQPEGKYGSVNISDNNCIDNFVEKPLGDGYWINGGFLICEPKVFDYIESDETVFEQGPLEKLAKDRELYAYRHKGFWKCMDTLRDKISLNHLWETGQAKWKVWE